MPKKDLTGMKFGKLTVLKETEKRASNGAIIWLCQCDCGNICERPGNSLTRKTAKNIHCGQCSNAEDLSGQKFNHLTVLRATNKRSNGKIVWECQCDCGNPNLTYVSTSNLKNGSVKSCGCLNKSINDQSFIDITNQKFNKLTALSYLSNNKWQCRCDCGNSVEVSYADLKNNRVKTCGNCNTYVNSIINNWLVLEQTQKMLYNSYIYKVKCMTCGNIEEKTLSALNNLKGAYCEKCHEENLIGQKFGNLTVIEKNKNQKRSWICKCECGKIIPVLNYNLKNGNTSSCGCQKQSKGETNIEDFLQKHKIVYEKQKTFESCRFPSTNALAKFDFYLPDYNLLIEYDGEQHFKEIEIFSDSLNDIKIRDNFKNKWCQQHQIPIIRIPYYEIRQIENILTKHLLNQKGEFYV